MPRKTAKHPIMGRLTVQRHGRRWLSIVRLKKVCSPVGVLGAPGRIPLAAGILALDFVSGVAATEAVLRHCSRRSVDPGDLVEVLRHVPYVIRDRLPSGSMERDEQYTPKVARRIAQAAAVGIHIRAHQEFARGLRGDRGRLTQGLADRVSAAALQYRAHLATSRRLVKDGCSGELRELLVAITDWSYEEVAELCRRVGKLGQSPRTEALALGIRMSMIARRCAMLSAALILVDQRLRRRRTIAPTQKIAATRIRLARSFLRPETARRSLVGGTQGGHISLIGRVTDVTWEERPRKPFSTAETDDGRGRLLVPYRSMRHHGVILGVGVCAVGTIEKDNAGRPYLEVEFEGPGQHARLVWEDWLADLARPAYDLWPGVLRMEWTFSRLCQPRAGVDLLARIANAR